MKFSIITPSFGQLDWLRLCVASVADQGLPEAQRSEVGSRRREGQSANKNLAFGKADKGELESQRSEVGAQRSEVRSQSSESGNPVSDFTLEHIIQDGGSPGIEEFAREVRADFYRDGVLIFGTSDKLKASVIGNPKSTQRIQESGVLNPESSRYRLSIYTESDGGMYDAINKGLARATGEICAWLNSDEQYLEGTIAKVVTFFSNRPSLDVLLGDAMLTDGEHRPVCYRRIMVPSSWHTRLDHLHSLSCAMFFRKSALPSPPLNPRWKVISDAVLMDYFLQSKKKVVACGQLLAAYSFTGKNLSANPANNEHAAWMKEMKWPPLWVRSFVVMNNRMRRLAHGAYAIFSIQEGLFTRRSPALREQINGSVSGRWPKETGFRASF